MRGALWSHRPPESPPPFGNRGRVGSEGEMGDEEEGEKGGWVGGDSQKGEGEREKEGKY